MYRATWPRYHAWVLAASVLILGGCTCPREYFRNCFKVGPNVCVPQGRTAGTWIDEADVRVREDCAETERWWTVFQDPTLNQLIVEASSQNLSLREAGFRVLEARAQLGIACGNLFPQSQAAFGGYQRGAASQVINSSLGYGSQFFDQWAFGFNLSWELDLWGRFRRAVTAAERTLDASCANYNDVLVTLLGDVASNYVQIRTLQQRIEYVRANIELQQKVLNVAERRVKAGSKGALDVHQSQSTLAQTEAQIPQLKLAIRQASDRLCILLGMPPTDLENQFSVAPIPTAPTTVAVGIPAELLLRRPDVRRAQYEAAAQGEQIGIAEADLYPMFGINGTLGYQSERLNQLFTSNALDGSVGPVFRWNILNYGRIRNNMRQQDARFWALVMVYQETVLRANAEVEDGLAKFLRAQERAQLLDKSVASAQQAVELVTKEYQGGAADFNRVALIQQNLVEQQDLQAQAHGEIAQGLIQVYRALGGGWQIHPTVAQSMPFQAPAIQPGPGTSEPKLATPQPKEAPTQVTLRVRQAATPAPTTQNASAPVAPLPREVAIPAVGPSEISAPTAPLPREDYGQAASLSNEGSMPAAPLPGSAPVAPWPSDVSMPEAPLPSEGSTEAAPMPPSTR